MNRRTIFSFFLLTRTISFRRVESSNDEHKQISFRRVESSNDEHKQISFRRVGSSNEKNRQISFRRVGSSNEKHRQPGSLDAGPIKKLYYSRDPNAIEGLKGNNGSQSRGSPSDNNNPLNYRNYPDSNSEETDDVINERGFASQNSNPSRTGRTRSPQEESLSIMKKRTREAVSDGSREARGHLKAAFSEATSQMVEAVLRVTESENKEIAAMLETDNKELSEEMAAMVKRAESEILRLISQHSSAENKNMKRRIEKENFMIYDSLLERLRGEHSPGTELGNERPPGDLVEDSDGLLVSIANVISDLEEEIGILGEECKCREVVEIENIIKANNKAFVNDLIGILESLLAITEEIVNSVFNKTHLTVRDIIKGESEDVALFIDDYYRTLRSEATEAVDYEIKEKLRFLHVPGKEAHFRNGKFWNKM